MTFVHPLLLAGLALIGIPVLIHLIMQQKPKRLPFPAFRFLLQRHRSNQRRLRLRHLLLLLLRMAAIAALALALARPKLTGRSVFPGLTSGRPVQAVFLIDTSYSMEYTAAGKTRLEEAQRRALEMLDELPEGSRIAVLDSAELGGEWGPSRAHARDRINALQLRHANAPLPRQIDQAYRLFRELDREPESTPEPLPRLLCIFSDRTRGCWDEAAARGLEQPADVQAVFIDVGQENASDLAIVEVKPERAIFWPGETARINVTVQATGTDCDTELLCLVDGETPGERRPLKLQAGESQVVTFERPTAARSVNGAAERGLAEGLHQVEVRLAGNDALPFDNAGHATFRVIPARRVLVLTDDPRRDDLEWGRVLQHAFAVTVRPVADAGGIDLAAYQVVCLVRVARPERSLWEALQAFVSAGGGLAVVPGGHDWQPNRHAYADGAIQGVLPGRLGQKVTLPGPAEGAWYELESETPRLARHPLLAPFARWRAAGNVDFLVNEAMRPRAGAFWEVQPEGETTDILVRYTDRDRSPALLERVVGRGRVLMLTTPFEYRTDPAYRPWNNYFGLSSFGLVLANLAVGHLAGDVEETDLNYVAGQVVTVPLPARPFVPRYALVGPGVIGADTDLSRLPEQNELRITQAVSPGNYAIYFAHPGKKPDAPPERLTAFSMSPRLDEHLLERVPDETIEALLGAGSVLPIGRTASLQDRLEERWSQPLEMAPGLLLLLLLVLTVESFLANRFYRPSAAEEQAT